MNIGTAEQLTGGEWQLMAACAGDHAALFYPPLRPERKAIRVGRENRAKAVCAKCPVRTDCLQHAVAHDERYGIWGGLTDKERRLAADPT